MIKEMPEDCETAEMAISFRDYVKNYHKSFDIMKTETKNEIKRIKEIRLFPGRDLTQNYEDEVECNCVGGIDIIYELNNGEEFEDGLIDLECKIDNMKPNVLELKDNECKIFCP